MENTFLGWTLAQSSCAARKQSGPSLVTMGSVAGLVSGLLCGLGLHLLANLLHVTEVASYTGLPTLDWALLGLAIGAVLPLLLAKEWPV